MVNGYCERIRFSIIIKKNSAERRMESCRRGKINGGRLEENILAILDASEARDTQDADDDRTY